MNRPIPHLPSEGVAPRDGAAAGREGASRPLGTAGEWVADEATTRAEAFATHERGGERAEETPPAKRRRRASGSPPATRCKANSSGACAGTPAMPFVGKAENSVVFRKRAPGDIFLKKGNPVSPPDPESSPVSTTAAVGIPGLLTAGPPLRKSAAVASDAGGVDRGAARSSSARSSTSSGCGSSDAAAQAGGASHGGLADYSEHGALSPPEHSKGWPPTAKEQARRAAEPEGDPTMIDEEDEGVWEDGPSALLRSPQENSHGHQPRSGGGRTLQKRHAAAVPLAADQNLLRGTPILSEQIALCGTLTLVARGEEIRPLHCTLFKDATFLAGQSGGTLTITRVDGGGQELEEAHISKLAMYYPKAIFCLDTRTFSEGATPSPFR